MSAHPDPTPEAILASARRTLQTEAQAIADLAARLDDSFVQVVGMLLACRGRVVVSGIGKTGHKKKLPASWPPPWPPPARRPFSCTPPKPSTATWGWSPATMS